MPRDFARKIGAGRLIYQAWHAPRNNLRRLRDEGAINLGLASIGRAAMERAAARLAALEAPGADAPEVYFLTGRRFAYQTAFCAASLGWQSGRSFKVIAIDDGTLRERDAALLRRVLPGVKVVGPREVEVRLDQWLPSHRYPELRARRLTYPHLRKLTDVHAASSGWKLVLDSDMLFHGRPDFLLDWLSAPDRPCHMVDVADAYGYSADLLQDLAGTRLPSRLNVGVCGLASDQIDWDRLEYWCKTLVAREGTHYLMEQALAAMLVAGKPAAAAPKHIYIVAPTRAESARPTAVLHHYTAETKAWYFRYAWRHIVEGGAQFRDERFSRDKRVQASRSE